MISKKSLAVFLSKLKVFDSPDIRLEQYPTDANIASEIIWSAYMSQDLEGKIVCDFGCGTGILGIGALIMGAAKVYFVDVDAKVLETLKANIQYLKDHSDDEFDYEIINDSVGNFTGKADTVLQNPPFGTKVEHSDKIFLEKAFETAGKIYSFHKTSTKQFVEAITKDHNFKITAEFALKFPLKKTFEFHQKKVENIEVSCFRLEKK